MIFLQMSFKPWIPLCQIVFIFILIYNLYIEYVVYLKWRRYVLIFLNYTNEIKNLIKVDKMLLLMQDKILGKNCLLLIERQLLQGSLRQNYPKQNIYDWGFITFFWDREVLGKELKNFGMNFVIQIH